MALDCLGQGGLFASFRGQIIELIVVKNIIFEGVANFRTKRGKKGPPVVWEFGV